MNRRYYVYEWFNTETGEIFYIGKGTKNRYCQLSGRNQFFLDYYDTHDCESRIIYDKLTEDEAYTKEIEIIAHYRNHSNFRLTNVCDGGEGHPFPSGELNPKYGKGNEITGEKNPFYRKRHNEKTRKILSVKASERTGEKNPFYQKSHSESTKQLIANKARIRLSVKENNPMYGKTHSEEAKRKMREANLGKEIPKEVREKISRTLKEKYVNTVHFNKGRKRSEELKLHYSLTRRGENNPNWGNGEKISGEKNPMYGKVHSPETREKMRQRAQNRKFDKVCSVCGKEFVAQAHNAKRCPECRPKRTKK